MAEGFGGMDGGVSGSSGWWSAPVSPSAWTPSVMPAPSASSTPLPADGSAVPGQMTWEQFAKMLGMLGGAGPQFGGVGTLNNPFAQYITTGSDAKIYKIGPTAEYNRPDPPKDNTSIQEVMQIAALFGA